MMATSMRLTRNGTQKWKFSAGQFWRSGVTVAPDGTIYALANDVPAGGIFDGNIYAVNPNGTQKWKFKLPDLGIFDGGFYPSPALGDDGTIYVGSDDGNLYAINPNGTQKWKFTTGGGLESSPAMGCRRHHLRRLC